MSGAAAAARPILLVGCGKMGGALLAGWRERRIAPHFVVVEPEAAAPAALRRRDSAPLAPATLPADLEPAAIVLAVKPQSLDDVLPPYRRFAARGAVFLSIAAGKTLGYSARAARRGRGGGAGHAEHAGGDRPRHRRRLRQSSG